MPVCIGPEDLKLHKVWKSLYVLVNRCLKICSVLQLSLQCVDGGMEIPRCLEGGGTTCNLLIYCVVCVSSIQLFSASIYYLVTTVVD